ncbi:Crp/Fnr family transcriptional regulator [Pedobacter sp. UYP1]|jgi:CRP/FNR family transcriptional regulator|uniref:Crp/Fnr family transcriptional regulator n=1 Tax=Pedobacter sp. UYP1 TaxID=1756396 RepID=UPI003395A2CE
MNENTRLEIQECFAGLGKELIDEITKNAVIKQLNDGEYLVREGQYIKYLPIILDGAVKVYSEENKVQFLLYYLKRGETCLFSFSHLFSRKQSGFSGIAERSSKVLLIPLEKAEFWLSKYPVFNTILLKGYQKHCDDLLNTAKQLICYSLEERVLTYLKHRAEISGSNRLKITHKNIAEDLASSREVITRLLKKMEKANKVTLAGRTICLNP